MLNIERLCLGCMNDNGGEKICPICGHNMSDTNPVESLPVKSVINNRYLLGKVLYANGEGVTYIGWDNGTQSIVKIKEYFPQGFAERNPDKTVSMTKGGEYTFNEGLLEFIEINRALMSSELPSIVKVLDVFEENGTVYAVSENISGIKLGDFLEKNGGTLKWEQARPLFLPLIDTVEGMNSQGIIHGGISTETVIVGRDGKLRIADYSISKLRQTGSELNSEIFPGFAAVEQYGFQDMHIDTYTDVYGLCATIFRVLIGAVPAEASQRINNDAMSIPAKFAEELPRQVLAALANGLQVLPNNRTVNIEVLKNEMVYGEIAEPIAAKKTSKDIESSSKSKKKNKNSSAKYAIISSVCTVLVFLIIAVVLIFTVFKDDIFKDDTISSSSEQASIEVPIVDEIGTIDSGAEVTAKTYKVPDFRAKYFSEIADNDEYEMFDIYIIDKEYSDQFAVGTVCKQSVDAGSEAVRDTKIELVISLGPKEIKIANLAGLDEISAKLELLKQGFLYSNIEILEKYDEDKESGVVIDQEPKYGESVSADKSVKIYINSYEEEEESSPSSR